MVVFEEVFQILRRATVLEDLFPRKSLLKLSFLARKVHMEPFL